MRIVQASLCLRFYTASGWTREEVRKLLREDQRLSRVVPRYFDSRDGAIDEEPHDECTYFAVYDSIQPFSEKLLAQHEIV